MRLTCPNCGAQYEVPDEVIPTSGRDVQCSNCGDTWFQHHPDHEPEQVEDQAQEKVWDAPEPSTPVKDEPEEEPSETVEASGSPSPDGTPDSEDDRTSAPEERRELDPEVTDVLREEAQRETAARASESSGLETQPELGLNAAEDESQRRSAEAQARMARLRGEVDEETIEDEDDGPDPGTRKNLLPDIDEINSSLDSAANDPQTVHPGDAAEAENTGQSSGFRRGFRTVILIALLGVILYVFAPQISETIPLSRV